MSQPGKTPEVGKISLFQGADLISAYTRAQAIDDGVLVDMTQGELGKMAKEAGFRVPLAMTNTAFNRYVALTPAAIKAGNDILGRWWDVLWMLKLAIRQSRTKAEIIFKLYCVVDRQEPRLCRLKSVIGPGDAGEPVMTIMLPEED